jgi:hypothetical protein
LAALGIPQFAPKAKRIIYLFQNGAPSQLESFDYKPLLNKMQGQDLPASIRKGQRLDWHDEAGKFLPVDLLDLNNIEPVHGFRYVSQINIADDI